MKQRFSIAAHNYFKVTNLLIAKKAFLKHETSNPVFSYRKNFNPDVVRKRIKLLEENSIALKSMKLVETALILQHNPSPENLAAFKEINAKYYGEPTKALLAAILARFDTHVSPETKDFWNYINHHISIDLKKAHSTLWPSPELFSAIQAHGMQYMNVLFVHKGEKNLCKLFELVMQDTGLTDMGWKLRTTDDASPAKINHHTKTVWVGSLYKPRTQMAGLRIVAHELYGHALRGQNQSTAESEGFAVLLEQLTSESFKPRRAYRYIAAALAWGVDGRPRDFRQTFEIVWRCMVIASKYTETDARSYAFDECVRIFRGGLPDVPGAIYLKDAIYLPANILTWKWLESRSISYNDFMHLASGRTRIKI